LSWDEKQKQSYLKHVDGLVETPRFDSCVGEGNGTVQSNKPTLHLEISFRFSLNSFKLLLNHGFTNTENYFHERKITCYLRHYATSRKIAASRPDEVNEFVSIYLILPAALGPGVHSASNRNEYQKHKNNVSRE
jgi:hypothetical protein